MSGMPQMIAVRRLWPGLYPEEQFDLPVEQADAAIASGLVFPMMPDSDPITSGSLSAVIRSRLDVDGEFGGLAKAATAYARRTRNVGLLHSVVTAVPGRIAPAGFTLERFRADYGSPPWYDTAPSWNGRARDPRAVHLAEHIDRRRAELLVTVFESIRREPTVATGFVPATGARTCVPGDVWWFFEAATVDMRTGGLILGEATLFLDVVVEPVLPKPPPRLSVAAIEQFVTTFAGEMLAAGRRFSASELLLAAAAEGVGPSANVVTGTLRRLKPTAWARRGRRSAVEVPTSIEIAAAAGQAREAVNHR